MENIPKLNADKPIYGIVVGEHDSGDDCLRSIGASFESVDSMRCRSPCCVGDAWIDLGAKEFSSLFLLEGELCVKQM